MGISLDIHKTIQDANNQLKERGINEILSTSESFGYVTLFSKNRDTQEDTQLSDPLTANEAYQWLSGFNTGLINAK